VDFATSDKDVPREWWGRSRQMSIDKVMVMVISEAWDLDLDTVLSNCITLYGESTTERDLLDVEGTSTLYMGWSIKRPTT
jgi:hypothetical protein